MPARVRHVVHWDEIADLQGFGSGTYQHLLRVGVRVQNGARRRVRVDTGRLRSSIHVTGPVYDGPRAGIRVGSDVEYAPFVGTHECKECWGDYLRLALLDAGG